MESTMLIRVNSQDTLHFLYEMQEMNMVKVLKEYSDTTEKPKLSDKFRGAFSKEAGKSFIEYTNASREEWDKNARCNYCCNGNCVSTYSYHKRQRF